MPLKRLIQELKPKAAVDKSSPKLNSKQLEKNSSKSGFLQCHTDGWLCVSDLLDLLPTTGAHGPNLPCVYSPGVIVWENFVFGTTSFQTGLMNMRVSFRPEFSRTTLWCSIRMRDLQHVIRCSWKIYRNCIKQSCHHRPDSCRIHTTKVLKVKGGSYISGQKSYLL